MKICCRCKLPKPKFYKDKSRKDGLYPECPECLRGRMYRLIQTPTGKKKKYAAHRRWASSKEGKRHKRLWNKKHPEVVIANNQLAYAVRTGRVNKPKTCSMCGLEKALQAHHHRGYAKAYWFDVEWLCKKCHFQANQHSSTVNVLVPSQPESRV